MAKKQINKRRVFILLIGIIAVFAIYLAVRSDSPISSNTQEKDLVSENKVSANFTCDDEKSISAEFINDKDSSSANLTLSDGRILNLSIAMSASGARYANSDESIVFWNKGNTAFLEENGVETYQNCKTSS